MIHAFKSSTEKILHEIHGNPMEMIPSSCRGTAGPEPAQQLRGSPPRRQGVLRSDGRVEGDHVLKASLSRPWWRDLFWLNQLNQTKCQTDFCCANDLDWRQIVLVACRPISGKFTSKSREQTFHQHQQVWVAVLEKVYGKENESLCPF